MLRCRVFGHRFRFTSEGPVMRWQCQRGCDAGGEKHYATEAEAQRYAAALDHEDSENLGRHAPLIAGLPLRIRRALRQRRAS